MPAQRLPTTDFIVKAQAVCIAAVLLTLCSTATFAETRPRIAIIIDDLGYELRLGQRAIALPGPIAVAVLPVTPRGQALAQSAFDNGKEVLLHLPLQAMEPAEHEDPGGLSLDMSRGQFAAGFAIDLDSVPHVIGVNTHRGSLLTRHPGHMSWLMEEIAARGGLFFVDSYTTTESVALRVARESGIPSLKRDVFLDFDDNVESIERELERLKRIARKRGAAVGIGHPYESTMAVLEREIPNLAGEGIDLVRISELIANTRTTAGANAAH